MVPFPPLDDGSSKQAAVVDQRSVQKPILSLLFDFFLLCDHEVRASRG